MIREKDVFKIGKFIKPHGIKGEITFSFDNDIFDKVDCPYLICNIEGILVPLFVKKYRFKGTETALISLEDITTEVSAKAFSGLDVFFPRKYFNESEEAEFSLDYFIGFSIVDQTLGEVGVIIDIDNLTINTLFLATDKKDNQIIVPASEDFIVDVDTDKKIVLMNLPEGLLDDIL
ncbi:MAG: rRNA processing protein RimM [Bacteroidota bacterium]|jgi:16S rRNA processing protein RimM